LADYLRSNPANILSIPTSLAATQTVPVANAATLSNGVLQLTNGANQVGEVLLSQARTLTNEFGFSTQFQLQVSGVSGIPNPATVALIFKSENTTYSLPFASELTNGTWTVWMDYNGLNDSLEIRYSQGNTRPSTANSLQTVSQTDLVGSSGNSGVQIGFKASTSDTAVTHNLLNWSFRDAYNPTLDSIQFNNFANTSSLTLSGVAQVVTSNNTPVLRLNNGVNQTGQFVFSSPISVDNDGSLSAIFQVQISGASGSNNGRLSFLLGGNVDNLVKLSLDNLLANGIWKIWVDYNGSQDQLELRYAQSDTRPQAAYFSTALTRQQLLGSDTNTQLYVGIGADTNQTYTQTNGTVIDLRQPTK
jgi:hypothetical protein